MSDRFRVDIDALDAAVKAVALFQDRARNSLGAAQSQVDGMPWQGDAHARFSALYGTAQSTVTSAVGAAGDLATMLATAKADYVAAAEANSSAWGGSDSTELTVSPLLVIDAAAVFTGQARVLRSGVHSALSSMSGCAHMGGDDKAGVQWSENYDQQSRILLSNLGDVATMIGAFGSTLDSSGQNHSTADVAARPLTGHVLATPGSAPTSQVSFGNAPTAIGGSAPTPQFWSWLGGEVSGLWPNGDTGKISSAGDAWGGIGDDLRSIRSRLRSAVDSLDANSSFESSGIRRTWETLAEHLEAAGKDCRAAADNCHGHAKNIDDAHSEMVNALIQLGAGAGITAALSIGLTPFTFGASDLVGAAAVAAEVTVAVGRIATIAARFLSLCRALATELSIARVAFMEWRMGAPALAAQASGTELGGLAGGAIRIASSTLSSTGRALTELTLGNPGARRLADGGATALRDATALGATPSTVPPWLTTLLDRANLPAWRRRILEGQKFNYENGPRYTERGGYNEVTLKGRKRVDSYIPGEEIVSRKLTQLSEVTESTAKKYLDELATKYRPGQEIRARGLVGEELDGTLYLEVPVQTVPVPSQILKWASNSKPPITIRDISGKELN